MKDILVIAHQPHSVAGRVGALLLSWGYRLTICRSGCGEPLPTDVASYAGVIILGGPTSANDDTHLDYIRRELHWIDRPLQKDVPFLGICLGAQLLARNLGGHVGPHEDGWHEIGYFEVSPLSHPHPLFTEPRHFYQWHGEGITLPAGIAPLAGSQYFPHQAFKYGRNAYGLQFHPEVTADMVHNWTENSAHRLVLPGAQARRRQLANLQRFDAGVDRWTAAFLDHWLHRDTACQPDPIPGSRIAQPHIHAPITVN